MYYLYITSNPNRTTLYVGVTNQLRRRLSEHFQNKGRNDHFANKYHCYHLIYYESFTYIMDAISREKEIKRWSRIKKIRLICQFNPTFDELDIP